MPARSGIWDLESWQEEVEESSSSYRWTTPPHLPQECVGGGAVRGFELLINFNKVHWRLPCGMWHICGACVTPPCASPPAPPLLKIATSRVAPSVGFCLIENRKSTNYEIPSGWHFPAFLRVHLLHLAIEQINRYIYCSMCI